MLGGLLPCKGKTPSVPASFLLAIYSQKVVLQIKNAKIKFFGGFSIARIRKKKFKKNNQISIGGSSR
jgi:hypothetical protein